MIPDLAQFHHPAVRELVWSLFSPSMVDRLPPLALAPWPPGPDAAAAAILAHLDRDPAPLLRHLEAATDRRLGARFEAMWTFYLEAHPGYDLLCYNWPVRTPDRTLGALDLLCRDRQRNAVVHCEIAVKYYLYVHDWPGPALQRWIGPNPDDSLTRKLDHLRYRQLPLSGTPEARQALRAAALPEPDLRATTIKGYLFHPWKHHGELPPEVTGEHLEGCWLRSAALPDWLQLWPGSTWQILEHRQWLQPNSTGRGSCGEELLQEVRRRLRTGNRLLMLAPVGSAGAMARNQASVGGNNPGLPARLFVAPDHWPLAKDQ